MTDSNTQGLRWEPLFRWGGVVIALLGLVVMVVGEWPMGLLLMAAGVMFWLFARRRTRQAVLE